MIRRVDDLARARMRRDETERDIMTHTDLPAPEDCPTSSTHGNPFLYCQFCTWTSQLEPVYAAAPDPSHDPEVEHLLRLFEYGHLPKHLQAVSSLLHTTAWAMAEWGSGHGIELKAGLRKLLEAKDCFVRQAVEDIAEVERRTATR